MTIRLALSGKMCAGKSTIAKYLVDNYGFTEFSIADRLKQIVSELIPGNGTKNRQALQMIGERFREVFKDVWINHLLKAMPKDGGNIVVSDVRYPNEVERLKENGFKIIRVEIDNGTMRERVKKRYPDTPDSAFLHGSETALDDYVGYDHIVNGAAPIKVVRRMIDAVVALERENENGDCVNGS